MLARTAALVLLASGLPGIAWAQPASPQPLPPTIPAPPPSPAPPPPEPSPEWFSVHFQTTVGTQYHPAFAAKYSGTNSMSPDAEAATAFVSSIYTDVRLWKGPEVLFTPEMSGGKGLSSSLGVAAFPNGIVYRVGNPAPAVYLARLALRQTWNLGGGSSVAVDAGPNQLAGKHDRDTLTVSVGRLAVTDVFDNNKYAHDPQTQFFNWALFAAGAWDYPADTRGYTYGVISDLSVSWWSLRGGLALEPLYANLQVMDWRVDRAHGVMTEAEARYAPWGHRGSARVLFFLNENRSGSYQQALDVAAETHEAPNVAATRAYGRKKYGFELNLDQDLTSSLGAFARLSWNDGATESWAFTEIDRCISFGLVQSGGPWHRAGDQIGAAVVVSGLSDLHRRYLAAGGYGFIIGDGALDYGPEVITDIYYRAVVFDHFGISVFYQPVVNPAYNRDRGPIHIVSARLQVAF
jgi:high affinity Mn2+ porin